MIKYGDPLIYPCLSAIPTTSVFDITHGLALLFVSRHVPTHHFGTLAGSTAGSNYFVRILSTLDREVLKPNTSVALHRHSHSVVEILPPESDSTIQLMQERPDVTYHDIGGMDMQKQEVREGGGGLIYLPASSQVDISPSRTSVNLDR